MNLALALALATLIGTHFASRTPNQEDLLASFRDAQGFYAEGAYDQAIDQYESVLRVQSRLLEVEKIAVLVGEDTFPVREASAYQIGNAHSKLYSDFTRFAKDSPNPARKAELQAEADSSFLRGVAAFRQVIDTAANQALKVQAFSRLVNLYFEADRFQNVVETAEEMIAVYPGDPRAVGGYYNRGWAYFEMKMYSPAIEAFEQLLASFPTGYQADRSLFQIGESYQEQGEYLKAIENYLRLAERQNIEGLSEEQLKQMRREKMAGLVDETALELAAKAEIQVGNCYTKLGDFSAGLAAYRRVITLFGTERQLVEEAYLRMADLYQEQGDLEQSLRTYREAIEQSNDRILRGRIQYALAERLFSQGVYGRAVQEYRIYLNGYGDIVASTGFAPGRVRYRIGSAFQQLAQQKLEAQDKGGANQLLEQAIAQYDTLVADAAASYYLDALFNRSLAFQSLGTPDALGRALEGYETVLADERDRGYMQRALIQLGELHFGRGEYARAAQRAQRLLDEFPNSEYLNEAQMRLALSRQSLGDTDGAVAAFLAIPEDSPHFARARLGGGHTLVTQRRFSEAIEVLGAGLARADDKGLRASFNYLIGQSHSSQGTYRKAVFHFSAALDLGVDGNLEEALHFSRGNAAFLAENYDLAVDDFGWVVENVRDADKVRSAKNALSLAYLKQDRGGEAIEVLDDMVARAQSPEEQAEILSRMMELQYERDAYGETVLIARQLLELDFDDSAKPGQPVLLKERAYFVLGDSFLRSGRTDKAAEVFNEALQQYPESAFATDMRLTLGIFYFDGDDLNQAKETFTELLQGGGLESNQEMVVRFYLANAHYSLREFADAQVAFQALIQDYPQARELSDILFGAAESLYQSGKYEEAIGYYERIIAEFPRDTAADNAQYNMGWCLIELKREEEAMEAMRLLLKHYPDSEFAASSQFTLGDYAYNRKAYQEALDAYLAVQTRYPESTVVEQVPRLIAELEEAIAYDFYERGLALMDRAEETKDDQYFVQAIEVFEEVKERYPMTESALGALSNIGVCLEGQGKWQDAVEVYDEVIGLYEAKRATKEAFQFAKSHRDWIVSTRL